MLQPMMFPQEQHVVWTERGVKRIRVKSELNNKSLLNSDFSFTFLEYNQLNKTIASIQQKNIFYSHTEPTEYTEFCSTYLHVSTQKNSHAKAQRDAELFVLLFLCQKSLHTEITEIHRNFASHVVLRKSAPSAWNNSTPYGSLLPTTFYLLSVPHGITHY